MSSRGDRARRRLAVALAWGPAVLLFIFVVVDRPSWVELHAHSDRCIRSPGTLSIFNFARFVAALAAVAWLIGFRNRAAGWALRPSSLSTLVRCLVALILALGVSEVLLRKPWHHQKPSTAGCDFCPLTDPDPVRLWKLKPSSEHVWRVGGVDVHYAIDAEGNRARATDTKRDHDRTTIFVAGESIAMAMAVPYEQSYAALLEDDLRVQVVDTGVHGYDMSQGYERLVEAMDPYTHVAAVVFLFVPAEAEREELEDRPHLRPEGDGLRLVEPPPAWVRNIQLRQLFERIYHDDGEIKGMRALARKIGEISVAKGAFPLFVTTNFGQPCIDVAGERPAIFRLLFDEQKLARIHVALAQSDTLHDDPHPGPHGHRILADAIEAALSDHGLVIRARP